MKYYFALFLLFFAGSSNAQLGLDLTNMVLQIKEMAEKMQAQNPSDETQNNQTPVAPTSSAEKVAPTTSPTAEKPVKSPSSNLKIQKYKDDFGLSCGGTNVIVYSPKNKMAYVGAVEKSIFYREAKIISETFKKTKDDIMFTAIQTDSKGDPLFPPTDERKRDYKIDRSTLNGSRTSYSSYFKKNETFNISCNVMPDDMFIEAITLDKTKYPPEPDPAPRSPNKI